MEHKSNGLIIVILLSLIGGSMLNLPAQQNTVSTFAKGLKILNYEGNTFEPYAYGFANNWTRAGNTVDNFTTYDFSNLIKDGYNVLMLPRTMGLNQTDIDNIATWYATGKKQLWLGGDSDYAGLFQADDTMNPLLATIGSALRVSSISIEDPVSNDMAAYRVIANETGVPSNLTDFVTEQFQRMVFHGPTVIHYAINGIAHDLRNATLGTGALSGVDIVINSSKYALPMDSDLSLGSSAFYTYSKITGHYPMLVTDQINGSMIIVAGEAVWTDYKYMYATFDENGADPHQGSMIVDRLINYYFLNVLNGSYSETSSSETSMTKSNITKNTSSSASLTDTTTASKPEMSSSNSLDTPSIKLPGFGINIAVIALVPILVIQQRSKNKTD